MPRVFPVVLAVALFAPAAASAFELRLLGLDDMSCAAWVKARGDAEEHRLYVQWVRGFLSGHNYARPSTQVSVVSTGTVAQFVDRYCSRNPTGNVADAAMRMSDQYSGRNAPIVK